MFTYKYLALNLIINDNLFWKIIFKKKKRFLYPIIVSYDKILM